MSNFLFGGGPFIAPILIVSGVSILFAVAYARTSKRPQAVAAIGAGTVAFLLSLLSLSTGFQLAAGPAAGTGSDHLFLRGVSEALSGVNLALLNALATAALVTFGAYRGAQRETLVESGIQSEPMPSQQV